MLKLTPIQSDNAINMDSHYLLALSKNTTGNLLDNELQIKEVLADGGSSGESLQAPGS